MKYLGIDYCLSFWPHAFAMIYAAVRRPSWPVAVDSIEQTTNEGMTWFLSLWTSGNVCKVAVKTAVCAGVPHGHADWCPLRTQRAPRPPCTNQCRLLSNLHNSMPEKSAPIAPATATDGASSPPLATVRPRPHARRTPATRLGGVVSTCRPRAVGAAKMGACGAGRERRWGEAGIVRRRQGRRLAGGQVR